MLEGQEKVRFGLYVADFNAAELKRGHDPVPIQNLPLRILALLVSKPGHVVSREEIRQALWPADTFVDFERGISTAVSKLREALGDSASNPRFIETVGRRGYRFIAPVASISSAIGTTPIPARGAEGTAVAVSEARIAEQEAEGPGPRRSITPKLITVALVLALVTVAALILIARRNAVFDQREIMSIAVLPLDNLSGDPQQEYLCDGITDAVTTRLAQIPDLRVISRTTAMHYKRTQKTAPEIARELGVDALIEGSVTVSGDQITTNVQLIRARDDRHLWANSYERQVNNVLTLEGELAREIAGQARIRLTPEQEERLARNTTRDAEAYALYLQGRFYWHQRRQEPITRSIGYFQQAIARDPGFAAGYAALADAYLVLPFFSPAAGDPYYDLAGQAASKALSLNPQLAEAHNAEAYVLLYRDWNFKGAEEEFQKAIALNPGFATAHQWYAELLSLEGRHEEAIREVNHAIELDALSAVIHHQAGQILTTAGQTARAVAEYQQSLKLDPQYFVNYFSLYRIQRLAGDYPAALDLLAKHAAGAQVTAFQKYADAQAAAYRRGGREAFLKESLRSWSQLGWSSANYYEAWDAASLGDKELTLQILEREYNRRNLLVLGAKTDPELELIRSDPGFQALMRKIGLPQ